MRRSPFVIGATIAGVAGVLTFHTRRPASPVGAGAPATASRHTRAAHRRRPPRPAVGPPTTGATGSARHAAGALVQYGYGELAVDVSVAGRRVTAVSVVTLRTAEQYSQQLAQQAIPVLRAEVLHAQSARIAGVSGATYTSVAYARSVQSALDKLHR